MCGISAIISLRDSNVDASHLMLMHREISNRGPDDDGIHVEFRLGLAHRRLAIVDTSSDGKQPFFYLDRYILVFNGEIYNHDELREELICEGFRFRSSSDTEVLIAAFAHWGESCQQRFNGMWSFVIWDRHAKSLFCSRDRFGIKPLYWAIRDDCIYLASEPKQLCAIGFGANVNCNELSRFLYSGIVGSTSSTFFSDIKSIPAAHSLSVSANRKIRLRRWYKLRPSVAEGSSIGSLLSDSIRLRLRSDVPVGSCLSGGLDSSSVVMLASSISSQSLASSLKCIHARSSDLEADESSYASLVADASSTDLLTLTPSIDQFWDALPDICRAQDEPFGSPSICMQYFVMQQARSNRCPVMLDGQGADEILLGYSKYIVLALLNSWRSGSLCKVVDTLKCSLLVNADLTPYSLIQYVLGTLFSSWRMAFSCNRLSFLQLPLLPVRHLYQSISVAASDPFSTQVLELFHTSLPALLRYEDRNSMAHSVEARVPFLDYRLVEASLSLPVDQLICNGWGKHPLRVLGILPESIAWRKTKLGFNAPERSWIGKYSHKMLEHSLDSPLIASVANRSSLEYDWHKLNRREQWRIFNVAMWADIYNVSI